jgi:hypothetical protein
MARITRDSSVINQFGSPSLNSNSFANRPAFGQTGRLFVDTTNNIIQRDTGTSWVTISGGAGSQNLQSVTTIGNTTTVGIFAGASGSLTAGRLLEVKGKTKFTDTSGNVLYIGNPSVTPNSATLDVYGYTVLRNTVDSTTNLGPILYSQYTINYNGSGLSGFANSIFAQDIYNVSASTIVASSTQSGTSLAVNTYNFSSASTITLSQPSGSIRAASAITAYSQFQNTASGTITHTAGIAILGIENLGGSSLTITNNYQLLINASDEFASTATITNRWGIYQAGANDKNYLGGDVLIGKNSKAGIGQTIELYGAGDVQFRIQNSISGNGSADGAILFVDGSGRFGVYNYENTDLLFGTNNAVKATLYSTGNLGIGTSSDSGRKLNVAGLQEWSSITLGTSTYTSSGNYLPVYVNNVLYYINLLL